RRLVAAMDDPDHSVLDLLDDPSPLIVDQLKSQLPDGIVDPADLWLGQFFLQGNFSQFHTERMKALFLQFRLHDQLAAVANHIFYVELHAGFVSTTNLNPKINISGSK